MDIPPVLNQEIQDAKVVLFLGAGASLCAKDTSGKSPPTARQLGELLANKFLGGKFHDAPLAQIAELSVSETDLLTVQDFIRTVLEPFQPSPAHKLLPRFKWAGLATTNYERLIELAYEGDPVSLQIPKPFIENGDRVEDNMRDPKSVMLLKPHGCLTRLSNPLCPLILTTDQYLTHRQGRSRIFDHLKSWGYEYPFIFIGSTVQDSDIRAILLELTATPEIRPRYYIVAPKIDDIEVRFWETKKITAIRGTFEKFMRAIDTGIPTTWRSLPSVLNPALHPVSEKFTKHNVSLTRNCRQFLESDVDYVKSVTTEVVSPQDFYRGYDKEWSAIEQKLDVPRTLADTIITDHILDQETNASQKLAFILIKAHAGAGKTVLLRRIAWDAARDYNALCLYMRPSGSINTPALQELISCCNERIYLFIDDIADRVRELQSLIRNIDAFGNRLTIIGAERVNEWNVACASLGAHVTEEYELRYLNNFEVDKLLVLLGVHKALGTLENKTTDEQRIAFREIAGRQLLVALHEATLGKPFEDIIENEYRNIVPLEAQRIYLSICVLNRLGVGVRAGIIARLHGVRFTEFRDRLFKPLEHVVSTSYDAIIRDYLYTARHPFIAEIVFERMLRSQEERFDVYLKCLQTLNIDYNCDRRAFRQMIRGRALLDLFSNPDLVKIIYDTAQQIIGEDGYFYHQKGLYEMHRGDLQRAGQLFSTAERLAPGDHTIKHSRSELMLRLSEQARTALERDNYLKSAAEIARGLKALKAPDSHAHHTLVKIDLVRLQRILSLPAKDSDKPEIEAIIKAIEKNLSDGLQELPGDAYLLTAEADFAKLLEDSERVISCLVEAFNANPRTSFIATRLAAHYKRQGKPAEATAVLEKAINANRNDRILHYEFAKHLMESGSSSGDLLAYHLQRAFSPGDTNYDAQLLYGRQLYENGDRDGSRAVFSRLRDAKLAPHLKRRLLYPIAGTFRGVVIRLEGSYLYINRDGTNDSIYADRDNVAEDVWGNLTIGTRCVYEIAFNFYGTGAQNLRLQWKSGAISV